MARSKVTSKKRVTLTRQILQSCMPAIFLTCMISILVYSYLSYTRLVDSTLESFKRIVNTAQLAAESELEAITDVVSEFGASMALYGMHMEEEELNEYLSNRAKDHNFKSLYITDAKGHSNVGVSFSGYNFFKEALKGKAYLEAPQISADGTYADIIVAAPLWAGGKIGSSVAGTVVAVLDGQRLSDIVKNISVGSTGGVYIIDKEGYTIASRNYEDVLIHENTILESANDKNLVAFAKMEKSALTGNPTTSIVKFNGKNCLAFATPITEYGWVMGAYATTWEYISSNIIAMFISVAIAIVLGILGAISTFYTVTKVVKPIGQFVCAVTEVSRGNYDVTLNYMRDDEMGDMQQAIQQMIESNSSCINDLSNCLEHMADGNFNVGLNAKYPGVFQKLRESVEAILSSLGTAILESRNAAESVFAGSEQLAMGSSNLSAGAIQQASSTQELAATIQEITTQVKSTYDLSAEAKSISENAAKQVDVGSNQMRDLMDAMQKISDKSSDISKIIKSIEDIAFQTNILALNAAVEAARAGAAGKGFAVVADEVRNLAQKSADAAKDTNLLIGDSLKAVQEGVDCAESTQTTMQDVVSSIHDISRRINSIAEAAQNQSMALSDVSSGVETISAITQTNSATAEEVAATSESLSEQASSLKQSMSRFAV